MNPERLKILQFIVASLVMGVVLFIGVTVLAGGTPPYLGLVAGKLSLIGIICTAAGAALAFWVTRALDKATESSLQDLETEFQRDEQLAERFQQRTIIGCGLLEGTILLNLTLNFLQPNLVLLILAVLLLFSMSLFFPTRKRVDRWFANRRRGVTDGKLNP